MKAAVVTGAFGFLGRHTVPALAAADFLVCKVDRLAMPDAIVVDLSRDVPMVKGGHWDVVFHLAGLAHCVPRTSDDARRFFEVNVRGTENLLRGLERPDVDVGSIVLVSTVAVYGVNSGELLTEDTPRLAQDPYGASKRQAEDLLIEWCSKRGIRSVILRLPLVAGKNPPGNLGAMISALRQSRYLGVGDGSARRSLVLASDVAGVLPRIAESSGIFHLTDGVHPSFFELEAALCSALGRQKPRRIPAVVARLAGKGGDVIESVTKRPAPITSRAVSKMTTTMTFADSRARAQLGWRPNPVLGAAAELVQGTS